GLLVGNYHRARQGIMARCLLQFHPLHASFETTKLYVSSFVSHTPPSIHHPEVGTVQAPISYLPRGNMALACGEMRCSFPGAFRSGGFGDGYRGRDTERHPNHGHTKRRFLHIAPRDYLAANNPNGVLMTVAMSYRF